MKLQDVLHAYYISCPYSNWKSIAFLPMFLHVNYREFSLWFYNVFIQVCPYPSPPPQEEGQFLSEVELLWIQGSFSRLVAKPKLNTHTHTHNKKNPKNNLPYYIPIVEREKKDSCLSQGHWCEVKCQQLRLWCELGHISKHQKFGDYTSSCPWIIPWKIDG